MHLILANAAIPVFVVAYPRLFWLLPLVIVFEFLVAQRTLGVPLKRAFVAFTVANITSTVVGAMLLVGICFAVASIGGSQGSYSELGFAFWLYEGRTNLWLTLAGMLLYFALCYIISVYLEHWIVRRFLRASPAATLMRYSWRVHIPSYAFLALLWTGLNFYWILNPHK